MWGPYTASHQLQHLLSVTTQSVSSASGDGTPTTPVRCGRRRFQVGEAKRGTRGPSAGGRAELEDRERGSCCEVLSGGSKGYSATCSAAGLLTWERWSSAALSLLVIGGAQAADCSVLVKPAAAASVNLESVVEATQQEESMSSYDVAVQQRAAKKKRLFTQDALDAMQRLATYDKFVEELEEREDEDCLSCRKNRFIFEQAWQTVSNEYFDPKV